MVQERGDLLFVRGALLGQGFVQKMLAFLRMGRGGLFADPVVGRRNAWVKPEHLPQHVFFLRGEHESEPVFCGTDEFHASRSMVACRLYFWSSCT